MEKEKLSKNETVDFVSAHFGLKTWNHTKCIKQTSDGLRFRRCRVLDEKSSRAICCCSGSLLNTVHNSHIWCKLPTTFFFIYKYYFVIRPSKNAAVVYSPRCALFIYSSMQILLFFFLLALAFCVYFCFIAYIFRRVRASKHSTHQQQQKNIYNNIFWLWFIYLWIIDTFICYLFICSSCSLFLTETAHKHTLARNSLAISGRTTKQKRIIVAIAIAHAA